MRYYKVLSNDSDYIGVASSYDLRKYQKKHNIIIKVPTSKHKPEKGKFDIHIPPSYSKQVPETARYHPKRKDIYLQQSENASNAVFNGNSTNNILLILGSISLLGGLTYLAYFLKKRKED